MGRIIKKEDVMKALRLCLNVDCESQKNCDGCPYHMFSEFGNIHDDAKCKKQLYGDIRGYLIARIARNEI